MVDGIQPRSAITIPHAQLLAQAGGRPGWLAAGPHPDRGRDSASQPTARSASSFRTSIAM
jgi:hypothetical protein